jgi:tetratricopeptide (TPR) repeat protein
VRSRVTEEVRREGHERAIGFYEANYREWDGTIESCRSELEGFYHACELGEYDRAYRILNRCVNQLDRAGEWRSLLPLYERLTCEWNAVDDAEEKNLGWAWIRSGNLHRDMGDYQSAIGAHLQAQEIFDRLDFSEGKAAALGNLGNAYYSLGDYQKAIDFHSQHNELAQAIGDKQGIANSFFNLGHALGKIDEHFNALQNYIKAKEIYEDLKLDNDVEDCKNAIRNCNQTIAAQRRTPPTLDDGYKSNPSYKKRQDRKQSRTLWFCVGIAIVLLIAWLKK